jgi:hypothetical protein
MYISNTAKQIFILLIALLIEAAVLLTCHHSPASMQDNTEQVETSVWVNGGGDIVSSLQGKPEAFAKVDQHFADSLAKVYKTKEKNLVEYIAALEHTNADLLADANDHATDYFPVDTNKKDCPPQIKNLRQTFYNPYYIAKAQLGDSPYLRLQAFDTITVLWKKVNTGSIFNRKHLIQLDVSTANPDTKVSGIKAYRINEKPKRWVIGFSAGYGFSMKGIPQSVPFVGLTLTKTIVRF